MIMYFKGFLFGVEADIIADVPESGLAGAADEGSARWEGSSG